jgi:hypothetical protein
MHFRRWMICEKLQLFHFRSFFPYRWLSFHSHEFSLHKVFVWFFYLIFVYCLLLFFLWVVSTCVLICLVVLVDGFPSLIFIYKVFFSLVHLYRWGVKNVGQRIIYINSLGLWRGFWGVGEGEAGEATGDRCQSVTGAGPQRFPHRPGVQIRTWSPQSIAAVRREGMTVGSHPSPTAPPPHQRQI